MDYLDEVLNDIKHVDMITIEQIRMLERIDIFLRLRQLINEKDSSNDHIASSVLGWAYEQLAQK